MSDPENDEPTEEGSKKGKSRVGIYVGLGVLGVLIVLVLVAIFSRNALATSRAASMFSERGFTCEDLSVTVSFGFDRAEVAPTVCRAREGHIAAIRLISPMEVSLSGATPTELDIDNMQIVLRSQAHDSGASWLPGDIESLNVRGQVVAVLSGLGSLASRDLPRTVVGHARVLRGQRTVADLRQVTLHERDDHLTIQTENASLANGEGVLGQAASVRLTGVRGSATADAVRLDGTAHAATRVPLIGVMTQTSTRFSMTVTGLSSAHPRFRFQQR